MLSRFSRSQTHSCVCDIPIRLRWGDHRTKRSRSSIKQRDLDIPATSVHVTPRKPEPQAERPQLFNREGTGLITGKHVIASMFIIAFTLLFGAAIAYATHSQ